MTTLRLILVVGVWIVAFNAIIAIVLYNLAPTQRQRR